MKKEMTVKLGKFELLNKALKVGTLPLVFKKSRGNWAAYLPSKIDANGSPVEVSDVKVCDWPNTGLRRLRFEVASRYLAQVYPDSMTAHVNLRWALRLPNWGKAVGGALIELAPAMARAGLI